MGYDTVDDSANPKSVISFKLLETSTINDCSENKLILTDFTYAVEERELLEYTIPTGGAYGADYEIPAREVKSLISGCPMTTVLELQTASGHWYEQRVNAEGTLTLDMDTTKIATLKLDQRWFLEQGLSGYYGFDPTLAENAAQIPEEFYLRGRFLTVDDTTG
jgi:hypothetical protein